MGISWIDVVIFLSYLLAMLGVGFYFMNKNKTKEDYFVGGRSMSAGHVGLSVVATDVGGGFSIGLGGLGFVMGLSGSWMLFTGLLGAWISAVLLIPKVYPLAKKHNFLSFPQTLKYFYNSKVALIAGLISFVGYIGFTSSQILAGAKLASATFPAVNITTAVLLMGIIAVVYTVLGGIKAVIYTDTIQWLILIAGLCFLGIPMGFVNLGGWQAIKVEVPSEFFTLTNIKASQLINWGVTIVPVWFIGMTLYQRIFSCKDEKTAKKAWRIAGLFEWPVMAFMGVILGLFARVAFEQGAFTSFGYAPGSEIDAELGLPLFLRHVFPVGLLGVMMSVYFSAIMSTADSCLMAASGNLVTDIIGSWNKKIGDSIKFSQLVTLAVGALSILLATVMTSVLDLMLYSYAFMVSGLFIPVLGMIFIKKPSPLAAIVAMIGGGGTTLALIIIDAKIPFELDANVIGISVSIISFLVFQYLVKRK